MEMLVPFAVVYATSGYSSLLVRALYVFAAVIMASSIFMSKSRGGVFGFAVEFIVLAWLTGRGRRMSRELKLLALFAVVLVLWLVLVPPSGLWEAFLNADEPGPGGRIAMLKDSLKMLWHRPVLGWGFGNFSVAYPAFRSFYTDLTVNAAHNDFVETAAETGLIGFALMVWWIVRLYRTALWRIRSWQSDRAASTALAALVGCSGLLAHSLMDFNLQVPANAALFFSLAAIATVMP
jgi:O-antigen ligase